MFAIIWLCLKSAHLSVTLPPILNVCSVRDFFALKDRTQISWPQKRPQPPFPDLPVADDGGEADDADLEVETPDLYLSHFYNQVDEVKR